MPDVNVKLSVQSVCEGKPVCLDMSPTPCYNESLLYVWKPYQLWYFFIVMCCWMPVWRCPRMRTLLCVRTAVCGRCTYCCSCNRTRQLFIAADGERNIFLMQKRKWRILKKWRFSIMGEAFSPNWGFFVRVPGVCWLSCLSRHLPRRCVSRVRSESEVLSSDIFGLQVAGVKADSDANPIPSFRFWLGLKNIYFEVRIIRAKSKQASSAKVDAEMVLGSSVCLLV